jgi:hypothetical protein
MAAPAPDPDPLDSKLFVAESAKYGDRYIEHLLEQYKIYIAAAEAISDRRQKANEFFLALNTALVAVLGLVATKALVAVQGDLSIILASIAGSTMCYLWYRIIRSYKGLNAGKFQIVHAVERRLPLALYDAEWEVLGRGENREIYWPFTHIELFVPWIFIAIYAVLFVTSLPWAQAIGVISRFILP